MLRDYDYCFKQPFNQIVIISETIVIIYESAIIIWTKCGRTFGRTKLRHLGVKVWSEFGISVVEVWLTSWLSQQSTHSHNFWNIVRISGYSNRDFWLLYSQILMAFISVDYLFEGLFKTVIEFCGQCIHNFRLLDTQMLTICWSASANKHVICSSTIVNITSCY